MRSLVVNWPAQFPAEAIEGAAVSGDLFTATGLQPARTAPPGSVFPSALEPALAGLCLHPSELHDEDLLPFIPRFAEIDQEKDRRVEVLGHALARAMSVHAVTTWLMENERWDFAAVSYGFIQAAPAFPDTLDAAYRFSDVMLGRLLHLAGEDTAVLLLSANGFHKPGQQQQGFERLLPWYSTPGFCCMSGPLAKRDRLLHGATLLDLTPTVLALLGLPVARDMQGRPLLTAFTDPPEPVFISSWEIASAERKSARQQASPEDLQSLGYRDPAAERIRKNEAAVERERALHRAAVYLDTERPQHAIPVLQELLEADPCDEVCGIALAYAYIVAAEWEQLRRLIPNLPENERTAPQIAVMKAMLSVIGGNVADALAQLKEAERAACDCPMLAYGIGCVYLRLRKWRRAERAFRIAAEQNEECWLAHQARAMALSHMGRRREAAALLRTSIQINFADSGSRYLLGAALADLGDHAGARRAFQNSLVLARAGR